MSFVTSSLLQKYIICCKLLFFFSRIYKKWQRQHSLTSITLYLCNKNLFLSILAKCVLKNWWKLDMWRRKEEVTDLKKYLEQMNCTQKSRNRKNFSKNRTQMYLTLQVIHVKKPFWLAMDWPPYLQCGSQHPTNLNVLHENVECYSWQLLQEITQ